MMSTILKKELRSIKKLVQLLMHGSKLWFILRNE